MRCYMKHQVHLAVTFPTSKRRTYGSGWDRALAVVGPSPLAVRWKVETPAEVELVKQVAASVDILTRIQRSAGT